MRSDSEIKTYNSFNEYYSDANAPVRSRHDEFHVFRFSDLGDDIVERMGPFSTAYYRFAMGSEVQAKVDVFDTKAVTEKHSMVIYLPGPILKWEKTGIWEGYVVNVKEKFLNLGSIAHLTESYGFLHRLQPLVITLGEEDYHVLSSFYELMLLEQKEMKEENILVIRNLMHILIVFVNRTDPPPKNIINEVLFMHAKTLLTTTDTEIKELAWSLNFDDYSHFVKFFKKMSGMTPAEYRKRFSTPA